MYYHQQCACCLRCMYNYSGLQIKRRYQLYDYRFEASVGGHISMHSQFSCGLVSVFRKIVA